MSVLRNPNSINHNNYHIGTGPPAQSFALICKLIRIALLAVNINDVSSIIPGISNGSPLPPMMLFLLRDYFLLLKKP